MKKGITILLLCLAIILPMGAMAEELTVLPDQSAYDYRVWVNGKFIEMPTIEKRADPEAMPLLPLRAILEADGAEVTWHAETSVVDITSRNGEKVSLNLRARKFLLTVKNGTTYIEAGFFKNFAGMEIVFDPAIKTVIVTTDGADYGDVMLYDLGEGTLSAMGGREIPYTINGSMALVNRDNAPVVVFMHGAHAIVKSGDNRYDLGFSTLMKKLAAKGYSVFSLNVNMQYSFENGEPIDSERMVQILGDHFDKMIAANGGSDEGFPVSLKGKLDLNQITLIGHSRSGQEVFRAAEILEAKGAKASGIISVAPAYGTAKDYEYPDIPIGIIIPQQDGDVMLLEGQKIYDEISELENRTTVAQLVYLYNANHNSFNEGLLHQDNGFSREKYPVMPQTKQREIFTAYVLDFLAAEADGGNSLVYNQTGEFYGGKALFSITGQDKKVLLAADGTAKLAELKQCESATLADVIASYAFDKSTAGVMKIPTCPLELPLFQINWDKKGAVAAMKLDETAKDFSGYKTLSFDIAQDSTSIKNNNADQAMTVTLTDKAGKTASVHFEKGATSLAWQEGEIITSVLWEDYSIQYYSNFTPLSSLRISLEAFEGVDVSEIAEIGLAFPDTDEGCIVIKSVSLMK